MNEKRLDKDKKLLHNSRNIVRGFKLDRLTGKTEIILNEQTKKYLKRKDKK